MSQTMCEWLKEMTTNKVQVSYHSGSGYSMTIEAEVAGIKIKAYAADKNMDKAFSKALISLQESRVKKLEEEEKHQRKVIEEIKKAITEQEERRLWIDRELQSAQRLLGNKIKDITL